ncbi:hypothetical protein F8S09_13600 [Deinococcus sp. SDU3-2]|uniref:Uncharacterized protein n=1 Tax=Deinococcus terrestris TaxID=2651870 RepID=A0A7X1TSQ3_9DEIO|nr:hypothetical protein [Deinococcus terrestris]MPY67704.1 hypothetical protein [Deinococcus terrestris]
MNPIFSQGERVTTTAGALIATFNQDVGRHALIYPMNYLDFVRPSEHPLSGQRVESILGPDGQSWVRSSPVHGIAQLFVEGQWRPEESL